MHKKEPWDVAFIRKEFERREKDTRSDLYDSFQKYVGMDEGVHLLPGDDLLVSFPAKVDLYAVARQDAVSVTPPEPEPLGPPVPFSVLDEKEKVNVGVEQG